MYRSIEPQTIPTAQLHALLLGSVSPRPICFASTIDKLGNVNLSPFSFFNVFGSNPPILIFSPARRVRDNTFKHTLENVLEVPEVVVNIVNYAMVEQVSLASCEYEKGVNEFIKAGFTALPSDLVKPPRVAESPVQFECKVNQVIHTGEQGGAGNLVICQIIKAHFKENIFDKNGQINPHKIDTVARMGSDWYCRASGDAVFEVPKPNLKKGIGFDNLPQSVLQSEVLTGNDLGRLANIEAEALPTTQEVEQFKQSLTQPLPNIRAIHQKVKELLARNQLKTAWLWLLAST
ncbi:MAG: flavin reductase family protein [Bacteroidia bacterium]|nr:flavin reductase family protein [Bacteroidia bacterium]MDW8300870.1 flavin reductase family protein [Bacteroidia bacterium]